MTNIDVTFFSHNRKAKCPPDPSYPNGIDLDLTNGAKVACLAELPYPAECCGVYVLHCKTCSLSVAITAAGRPDDPKSVWVPCKLNRIKS